MAWQVGSDLRATPDDFAEFMPEAKAAQDETRAALIILLSQKMEAEAEQERIKAEREELARLRQQEEERKADQAIFFAGTMSWLASGTATLECNWVPGLILRLEYRHDHSDGDAFFTAPGSSALFSGRDVGRNLQDTLTAGAVVWF